MKYAVKNIKEVHGIEKDGGGGCFLKLVREVCAKGLTFKLRPET